MSDGEIEIEQPSEIVHMVAKIVEFNRQKWRRTKNTNTGSNLQQITNFFQLS